MKHTLNLLFLFSLLSLCAFKENSYSQPLSYDANNQGQNISSETLLLLKTLIHHEHFYLGCSLIGNIVVLFGLSAYIRYSRKKYLRLNLRLSQLEDDYSLKNAKSIKENREWQKEELCNESNSVEYESRISKPVKGVLPDSNLCNYFGALCRSESNIKVPAEKWESLEEAINNVYCGFTEKLLQQYKLNSCEYHICLLIKIGISPKDMAHLTNHSKESVASIRRRLYEKFFRQKGTPQQWDEYILSL